MGLYYKIKLPLWCTCGVPVPVWDASSESDRVGHFFARVGCMPFLKRLKLQQECITKLNYHFGARVGCQCPCGVLVQKVTVWDTFMHV